MKPPLLLSLLLLTAPLHAADKITYDENILPIFEKSCLNCHNPDKKKGDLDLSSYTGVLAGGSGGKIAEAGDGASSRLFSVVTHTAEPVMPPKGGKLAKADADLIRTWVDGGLLENESSKPKARTGPKIDLSVKIDASAKPEGPPPMPEGLPLEPVAVGLRATTVADLACSPWAPLVAVTGQKQVLLYNTDTLRLAGVLSFPKGQPETLAFHPAGKYLLAGGGIGGKSGTTVTWDVTTGEVVMTAGRAFDSVLAASLRPDLGAVIFGDPSRRVRICDTRTGEQVKSIKKHTDWVTALACSPDGVLFASGDRNGGAWVWEAESGNEFHTLRAHQKGITSICWRSDSNLLATASEDGQVLFWKMETGDQVKKLAAHGGGVLSFDYARDGRFVTSGRDKKVKIWKPDFNLEKELPAFPEMVVEVAITHDGKTIFTADWNGRIDAWDGKSFQKRGELEANPPKIADRLVALQGDLKLAAAATVKAKAALANAGKSVAQNQATLKKAVGARDAAKNTIATTGKQLAALKQETAKIAKERERLQPLHAKAKTGADQARAKLKTHDETAAKAKAKVDQLTAADPPEPEKLKAAAGRFAELKSAREPLVKQAAAAGNAFTKLNASRQKVAADSKASEEKRKTLAAQLQSTRQKLPQLEKAIKPAQDQLAARQKALAAPKKAVANATARELALRDDLKFWRTAAK